MRRVALPWPKSVMDFGHPLRYTHNELLMMKYETAFALLKGANLRWTDLALADLRQANLQHADLREANLQNAQLQGANLQAAKLEMANLTQASYDHTTQWPDHFDPQLAGAVSE